eukprot:TRINITY_DN3154_c0_g1_i1.p2 TRINITY_DN3154_c0_g1~~TRINITY_DN3154_c0_g1_i1.p2  ORF type:complete len:180 (+),score=35.38 TRINITY_DN3154_c0_g1_i1:614-1153(+)
MRTSSACTRGADFHPNYNNIVLVGLSSGELQTFDIETGALLRSLRVHDRGIHSVEFGNFAAADCVLIGSSNTTTLIDYETGAVVRAIQSQSYHSLFSPSCDQIYTCSEERCLKAWDAKTGQALNSTPAAFPVYSAAFFHQAPWAKIGPLRALCMTTARQHPEVPRESLPQHIRDELMNF